MHRFSFTTNPTIMAYNELKHISRELINEFMEYESMLMFDNKMSIDNYMEIKEKLIFRLCHYHIIDNDNSLFTENGKMGMKNNVFGTILIPPIYDEIPYAVHKGYYSVAINDNKYGIVKADGKGTVIFPFIYDLVYELGEGYYVGVYCVTLNGKQGIVSVCRDITRTELEPEYDYIEHLLESHFTLLKKDGKCGLWNYGIFIPPIYEDVFVPEVLGWIMVKKDGKWGYIDENNDYTDDINKAFLYHLRA